FAFRVHASRFGHNAPDWHVLKNTNSGDWTLESDDAGTQRTIYLNAVYNQITPNSWAVITRPDANDVAARIQGVSETGLARYGVTGKSTRLQLDDDVKINNFSELRQTTVHAQSEQLALAETPVTEPVAGHVIELDQ